MILKNIREIYKNKKHRAQLPYTYSKMNTVADDIYNWCKDLSSDFDTVVAIPRSGLIVGSIISTYFGKPLSTPDLIIENKKWMSKQAKDTKLNFYNTILLVDDFVWTGTQLSKTKQQLEKAFPDVQIRCASLYINESLIKNVDIFYKTVPSKCLCHWDYNIMHGKPGKIAFDMDGVLCFDWDNLSDYDIFLRSVKPYRIPTYEIDYIITARLEKYRVITETWLKDHNITYSKLYMRSDENEDVVKFKSQILLMEQPELYVESHPLYAKLIQDNTGITTICTGDSN